MSKPPLTPRDAPLSLGRHGRVPRFEFAAVPVRAARFAVTLVLAALLTGGVASCAGSAPHKLPPLGAGYWHTQGVRIVDAYGRPVRIAAVTWFGAESTTWVPAGLDFQPYRFIMREVKRLGYNTIRLPFCNELVERDPVITSWVAANPQFLGA